MAVAVAQWSFFAAAQTGTGAYPTREVQFVVPNEPGGGLDFVARVLASGLGPLLGRNVLVINRSGASGNVGTASVARADPDGYTLLVTGVGHLVSPMLHDRPGYDAVKDFVPVARIAIAPTVLLAHRGAKSQSLRQLLNDPKSRAEGVSFASAGYGHSSHMAAEVFMARTGQRWLHVPYRGTGPASRALVSGEVDLMFAPSGSAQALMASDQVVALGVAGTKRLHWMPNLPTLAEQGLEGVEFYQWYGLFAPAGTPAVVLDQLQSGVAKALSKGDLLRQFQQAGLELDTLMSREFAQFLNSQSVQLATLVQRLRIEGAVR